MVFFLAVTDGGSGLMPLESSVFLYSWVGMPLGTFVLTTGGDGTLPTTPRFSDTSY